MRFIYQAVDSAGHAQSGELEAGSRDEVMDVLLARDQTPVSVDEKRASVRAVGVSSQKVRQSDLVSLVRELATLLSSGVGMTEALATLIEATSNAGLQQPLKKLSDAPAWMDYFFTEDFPFDAEAVAKVLRKAGAL